MLGLSELKKTRVYQEAREEGKLTTVYEKFTASSDRALGKDDCK